MATPNPSQNIAQMERFNELIANLNSSLQQFTATSGAAADILGGNFKAAGEQIQELHNPIFKLNAAVITSANSAKKMGLNMEEAFTLASLRAQLLVNKMEMIKTRFLSIPQGFMARMNQGLQVESERIAASAGIMRSEYAKSIPEAQRIISEVRKVVIRESAPLPGDTGTHLSVLSQTIDDSMKMAKDANKSMAEAQEFSAMVAGRIGAIGGTAGADEYHVLRFANALTSGSLSANARLDLVERNPAVKTAMKQTFKEYGGVTSLDQISKDKRFEAITKILDKAMPEDQLEAASQSFGGAIEGFQSSIKSLFDFSRTVNSAFEDYEGPDLTVFEEVKDIAIQLINPLKSLIDAIIANPILDPMTNLVRVMNTLQGFFGGKAGTTTKDYEGMDLKEAGESLGFIEYGKFLTANSNELIERVTQGDKYLFGNELEGNLNSAKFVGKDIPTRIINDLVVKFRTGIDGLFASINGFLNTTQLINSYDIGGSIGVVMAEITNSIIYLFNNLLPIIISQTLSMFRRFKEQINITDLLRFLQLFNGMRTIWQSLQDKISKIAEEAPKLFNKLSEGLFKFSAIFGGVGTAMTMFGGLVFFVSKQFGNALGALSEKIYEITGQQRIGDFSTNQKNRNTQRDEALRRLEISRMDRATRKREGISDIDYKNALRTRVADAKTAGGPLGILIGQHRKYDQMLSPLGQFNPLGFMMNFGTNTQGEVRRNAVQKIGGKMAGLQMPLFMASQMGFIPEPLANIAMTASLGTNLVGNIMNLSGMKGLDPTDPRRIKNERLQRRLNESFVGNIKKLKFGKASEALNKMVEKRVGPFGNIFGRVLIPFINILGKIPPGLITAIASNIPLILGSLTFILGIFKRAYSASPELQRAVARFMTGLKKMFDGISRLIVPVYKNFIQPMFKVLGDFLAKIFNFVMDLLSKIPGIDFGRSDDGRNTRSIDTSQAIMEGRNFLDEKTKREEDQIQEGRRKSLVGASFKGFIPGQMLVTSAAGGFGDINIPSLMSAATLESKMMPANERLIMANTSETILTKEQMRSGNLMGQSNHYNIPKIDIMINSSANQNANQIANEVASVLMTKLRDLENTA